MEGDLKFLIEFFNLMNSINPKLAPIRIGSSEPCRVKYSHVSLAKEIEKSPDWILWNASSNIRGIWSTGWNRKLKTHNSIVFYGKSKSVDPNEYLELYKGVSKIYPIDFGWIHVSSDVEFQSYVDSNRYEAVEMFNVGPSTHDLKKWIPNLAWGTLFGQAYCRLIGKNKLLSTTAGLTERINSELIYLQINDDITSTDSAFENFDQTRSQVIHQIGTEYFFTGTEDSNQKKAPQF